MVLVHAYRGARGVSLLSLSAPITKMGRGIRFGSLAGNVSSQEECLARFSALDLVHGDAQ
jgi:hypothetical protein